MAASLQSMFSAPAGSSLTVIELEGHEYRLLWRSTDSIDARGEFRQWLHIFALESDPQGQIPSVKTQHVLPWVNLIPKPCIETLTALEHMTQFKQLPPAWRSWSWNLSDAAEKAREKNSFGPYWMLLPIPGLARLAQEMVSLKRRIQNEMFRDADPWCARTFERRVIESMEPFLIYQSEKS